jgi:hypothetical protein
MTRTYVSRHTGRGNEIVGPHDITYVESVDFDARLVHWSVRGHSDGSRVDYSGTRPVPQDWVACVETTDSARAKGGWTLAKVA